MVADPMEEMPKLLIRADASSDIGTGHIMRMIALAQAWRRRGGAARFISCACPESIKERVEALGFTIMVMDMAPGSDEDADFLLAEIKKEGSACVAIDGYVFGAAYQGKIRPATGKLLVMDDYGHLESYNADIILNQNPSAGGFDLQKRGHDASVLEGTHFALLREEFLNKSREIDKQPEDKLNVLVTLGGSDPENVTLKVLEALSAYGERIAELRVICGGANPHYEVLSRYAESMAVSVQVIRNTDDMPGQISWADLAICASGSTCWELAFFGVSVATVVLAENQVEIAASLEREKCSLNLGWHADLDARQIEQKLKPFISDQAFRTELAGNFSSIVDGKGADRVAAALEGSLRVTIATAENGWLRSLLPGLVSQLEADGHEVAVVHDAKSITKGDVLLLLSFWSLLPAKVLQLNTHNLVVHESALPAGRGWSPVTWQVLEGKNQIPVCLFEAEQAMDSGNIYLQANMELSGGELIDEIRKEQARVTFDLCSEFIRDYPSVVKKGKAQSGEASTYPRRGPEDSRLDPAQTISEQFNLLRVVDNDAYPAFFEQNGRKYILKVYPTEQ